jgi:DNA-3-methyladenine glycosylase II
MPALSQFADSVRVAEQHLMKRDPVLRPHIRRNSPCKLRPYPHGQHFATLVTSILSQQLSSSAAGTIIGRFKDLYLPAKFPEPGQIIETEHEDLRGAGLSNAKARYVKDLAARTIDGTLALKRISRMKDDEVIEMLVKVNGIGVWTAHMFLMFSLGRLDVLPVGDLGIRKGIQQAYGLSALPSPAEIEDLAERRGWRPYCSVASWHLWRIIDG